MVDRESGAVGTVGRVDRGVAVRETAAAVLLLAFAVSFTALAFGFGEEARRLPLVVGFPLSAMAIINLALVVRAQWFRPAVAEAESAAEPEPADPRGDGEEEDAATALRKAQASAGEFEDTGEGVSFAHAFLTLTTVTGLFLLLGLIPSAVLFTAGYVRFKGGESWGKALAIAATLIALFWLFNTLLNVRFYEGWLASEGFIPYVLPF